MKMYALSKMPDEVKQKLYEGMKLSEKGRHHLQAMREAREYLAELFEDGATFRISQRDYDKYIKDYEDVNK